jgi:hypothetical protein
VLGCGDWRMRAPHSFLCEALRALLAAEARQLTVTSVRECERLPPHLPKGCSAVVCDVCCASGAAATVSLAGPPAGVPTAWLPIGYTWSSLACSIGHVVPIFVKSARLRLPLASCCLSAWLCRFVCLPVSACLWLRLMQDSIERPLWAAPFLVRTACCGPFLYGGPLAGARFTVARKHPAC